jgi:hypothetical protein
MVARCWLEVWDHGLENRLVAGYVSDSPHAGVLFDQLCVFVSWEDWDEVFLCAPMELEWGRTRVYWCTSSPNRDYAMSDVHNMTDWILDTKKNQQLVIRKRRTPGLREGHEFETGVKFRAQGNPYMAAGGV